MTIAHNELSALELAEFIREGRATSRVVVESCLERIAATDESLQAWQWLDADAALAQADELDRIRRFGKPLGVLHGVPVGIKDIIDVKSMPTSHGSPLFPGRKARRNAFVVDRLHDAGAVILGKTVTTELAFMNPARTGNPHDLSKSPGGSSAGSAAAVAHCQVPLAIGSQTNGSVIRPASFCGVFGFKPTRGVMSTDGVLETCPNLDQLGVFGRSLEDVAALADAIGGHDSRDRKSTPWPRPRMLDGCRQEVPVEPAFAWFEPEYFDRLADDARQGFEEVIELLGDQVERIPVPEGFDALVGTHGIIMDYEFNGCLGPRICRNPDLVSDKVLGVVERAASISEAEYGHALDWKAAAEEYVEMFFRDFDAIIAPAAPGEAPSKESGTGDPIFCTAWTLCGLPTLTLPVLTGNSNLPIGLQLIGGRDEDARLMRTARWLINELDRKLAD